MRNHTDLLNFIAQQINAQSYLEIGVSIPANNFDKIQVPYKIGVDPNPKAMASYQCTSDEFFDINQLLEEGPETFDLIFIDGLHHADQVQKDFENSLKILNAGGVIMLHDTYPEAEYLTHVPRDKKGRWLGDVYKFACRLNEYAGIDFRTVNFDNGCTVVWRAENAAVGVLPPVTWDYFQRHRGLLRAVSPANFQAFFPQWLTVNS